MYIYQDKISDSEDTLETIQKLEAEGVTLDGFLQCETARKKERPKRALFVEC